MRYSWLLMWLLPLAAQAQAPAPPGPAPVEMTLSRQQARPLFGTYEFAPDFQMRIFSENQRLYAQRVGDAERFELFARQPNLFFLKAMPAELEFRRGAGGRYDSLVLHQGGKHPVARRLTAAPVELYDTVLRLDSALYAAYNQRDLAGLMRCFAPTLEFYHDQTGLTTYAQNRERFRENFARPATMRRELVPGSLEVYPVPGFGAIELGRHRFYQTNPGQPEKLVGEPRFMQLWRQTGQAWQVVRVASYDH